MAASDRALPSGIVARPLHARDLDAALALSREAGWNQIAADWQIFLELGSVVCLTRGDGPPIATAATLPYAGGFAWISMVLVTATERRQGLARWLLRACVDDLVARNLVPVLDATPAGRTVYVGLGFQDCWTMRRLIGRAVQIPAAERDAATVRPLETRDWPQVIAYDTAVFGADRSALLRRLANRLPHAALVAEREGRIVGFLLGRDGRVMSQLGPLAAEDDGIATALLSRALAAVPAPLVVDVPDHHAALCGWLAELGFAVERPYIRMAYGTRIAFDDGARLFAIAGPELG
jgi:GNAT superfamily N-acetyltransferase